MGESIGGQGLTFAKFVDRAIAKCSSRESMSVVDPQRIYRVILFSKVEIPGKELEQKFDENYLLPIAKELGFNLVKTAKIIALRNAWITYFQKSGIPMVLVKGDQLLTMNEIVMDYIVLTSSKWTEHARLKNSPWMLDDNIVSPAEAIHNYEWDRWYEDGVRSGDIWFTINEFRCQKGKKVYSSALEKNADYAAEDIKIARKRINELHSEIKKQELIIDDARKPIRKFQNHESELKKKAPGRPKISEMADQQQRRDVTMKFVEKWVNSLMSTLSITSCAKLPEIVGGQKMTWWRWLNKEMLPSSSSLESFLDVKIKSEKHPNTKLRDLQTTPALIDLITLVELV